MYLISFFPCSVRGDREWEREERFGEERKRRARNTTKHDGLRARTLLFDFSSSSSGSTPPRSSLHLRRWPPLSRHTRAGVRFPVEWGHRLSLPLALVSFPTSTAASYAVSRTNVEDGTVLSRSRRRLYTILGRKGAKRRYGDGIEVNGGASLPQMVRVRPRRRDERRTGERKEQDDGRRRRRKRRRRDLLAQCSD